MNNETYRGVVRQGMIVLLENETALMEGTEVFVTPVGSGRGTAAGVLAAVKSAPHVPPEWVDELEQAISSGRRPPTHDSAFAEEFTTTVSKV
jgi:hypothetical protein